ncbi:MAG TPA: hypothetical protein VHW73_11995 [Rudaea sp.]|nr:hypothetical protein [Rudaea sp.]
MNTPVASEPVELPPETSPPAETGEAAQEASLRDIAHEGIEYLRNFAQLFLGEVEIARGSFTRLLIAGALIPVFLLTIWAALNLLLAALVARWLQDWLYGYLAILIVNGALVTAFVLGMKRWKRDLTLPRSRAALARLLERVQ